VEKWAINPEACFSVERHRNRLRGLRDKLLSSENAKQLQWNNEIGWRFDIKRSREVNPEFISLETFFRAHPHVAL
jgi:hypothetical protein